MKRIFNFNFLMCLMSVLGIAGVFAIRRMDPLNAVSRDGFAMDTTARITASATKPGGEIEKILDGAFALLENLDENFSAFGVSSDVVSLAANAGRERVTVSRETWEALAAALSAADLTDGAYDPTVGPVAALWREKLESGRAPEEGEIASALDAVGYKKLSLSAPDGAYLDTPGAAVDLGGIGKGYASGKIRALLRENGVTSALIDLGGNVVVMGGRARKGEEERKPWRIGIQDPSKPRGAYLCVVSASEGSVITAGVYERFREAGGHRYTHIFDPFTGRPVEGPLKSVTVVSDDPALGDALSTAFIVMGEARALDLLRIIPGVDAIFVSEADGRTGIVATGGLKGTIEAVPGGPPISFHDISR
jgi:thiamine biosynthesis lipoprotein